MKIPRNHPRFNSLVIRHRLIVGVEQGVTSFNGLIAQGRGEAFDYLLGEKTHDFAKTAIKVAAKELLNAKHAVISVNGNMAALVSKELVSLANFLNIPLEVNLFTPSKAREDKIAQLLKKYGAKQVILTKNKKIPQLSSNRKFVNEKGIYIADLVFVPLEDGDRVEKLVKLGKKVIAVDLNPLSRTARSATITIVDNIIRVMPLLIAEVKKNKNVHNTIYAFNNHDVLKQAEICIRSSLR